MRCISWDRSRVGGKQGCLLVSQVRIASLGVGEHNSDEAKKEIEEEEYKRQMFCILTSYQGLVFFQVSLNLGGFRVKFNFFAENGFLKYCFIPAGGIVFTETMFFLSTWVNFSHRRLFFPPAFFTWILTLCSLWSFVRN